MLAEVQAIFDTLNGDSTITSNLGTYQGNAAIFDGKPAEATGHPYLVIRGPINDDPEPESANKQRDTRRIDRDLACYHDVPQNPEPCEVVIERCRELFHRQSLTVTGWGTIRTLCTGPEEAPTGDQEQLIGRMCTITNELQEV